VTRTGTTALTLSEEIRQRFDGFSRCQKDVGQCMVDRLEEPAFHPAEELARRVTTRPHGVEYEYPVTLGRDYAGVVEQAGGAVGGFKADDQVFGFLFAREPDRARRNMGRAGHRHRGALDRARAQGRRPRHRGRRAAGRHYCDDTRGCARPL
jgi:hypothetical protein